MTSVRTTMQMFHTTGTNKLTTATNQPKTRVGTGTKTHDHTRIKPKTKTVTPSTARLKNEHHPASKKMIKKHAYKGERKRMMRRKRKGGNEKDKEERARHMKILT